MDRVAISMPFAEVASAAFPSSCQRIAQQAETELRSFLKGMSPYNPQQVVVEGTSISVPYHRIYFTKEAALSVGHLSPAAHCLLTRSDDGYLRQAANRAIIDQHEPWAIPFVMLLLGEYVVEIVQDIHASVLRLDRTAYAEFVRQNRGLMRKLHARATTYWSYWYRNRYPDRRTYPALATLAQLEEWAS